MKDGRTKLEKFLWERIGPPLYYCRECLKVVKVETGDEVKIRRTCQCECEVIAPRKSVLVGKGGANLNVKLKTAWMQFKAKVTGRDC